MKHSFTCDVDRFLFDGEYLRAPIFDVRSPSEFQSGHIPGSVSLPLFSDSERQEIGTLYKHSGHISAVMRGLEIVGPKMASYAAAMREFAQGHEGKIRILCWRGGMRSESMSWLATQVGLQPLRLQGGYKSFRRKALHIINMPRKCIVVGGYTGSGKTELIQRIQSDGIHPAIDLEGIACHRGSVFGSLPSSSQRTQEQFENELAVALYGMSPEDILILEDESRMVGPHTIPAGLWTSMKNPLRRYFLSIPREERLKRVVQEYGGQSASWLISCVHKLSKKLGGKRTQEIVQKLERGLIEEAALYILEYYDAAYEKSLHFTDQAQAPFRYVSSHEELMAEICQ